MNVPFRSLLTVLALSTSAYLLTAASKVGAQEEGRVKMNQSSPTTGTPHVIGTPYEDGGSARIGSSGSAKVGSSGSARVGSPSPAPAEEGSAMIGGYSGRATVGGSAPYTSANVGGGNGSASASVNVPQSWYVPPSAVNQDTYPGIGYRTTEDPFEYKLRLDKRVGGLQGYENGYTNLGAFLPFGNGDNSLWFADIRAMITDNGKAGANLGFGHRYYMDELDAVQGFSFWYDYDDGHRGDANSQIGLSYSLYTRYWRINANGYIVTSEDNQIVSSGIFGSPFYVNDNIGLNRLNTQETAYSGGEVEIGGPMPLLGRYGVDAYVGVYGLTAQGGEDAIGVKGRFEAQINEDLTISGTATQDRVFDNNYQLGIIYTFPKNFTPSRWFRQRKVYEAMALADRRDYRVKVDQTQFTTTELLINPADGDPFRVAHIIPPEGVGQGVIPGGSGRIEDPFVSLASYNNQTPDIRDQFDIIMVSQPNAGDPGVNLTSGITIFQNQRLLSNNGLTNLIESTVGTFALPDTGFGFGITPILTNAFEDANNNGVLNPTEDLDLDGVVARGEDRNENGALDLGEDVNGNGLLDLHRAVVVIDPSRTVLQNSLTEVRGFVIDGSNAGTAFPGGELNDGIVSHRDPNGDGILNDNERITGFLIHDNTIRNVKDGINLATQGTIHEDVDFDGRLDTVNEDLDGDNKLDLVDEDTNGNTLLDVGEDLDGDGNLDVMEDVDLDGNLDIVEDLNADTILDIGTEGIIQNNIIIGNNFQSNRGILIDHSIESLLLRVANNQVGGFRGEDANGNGILDAGEDNNGDGLLDSGIGVEIINTADGTRSNIFANNLTGTNPDYANYGIFNNTLWRSEDIDGDGRLDSDEDTNNNGILDGAEDVDGDGRLDVDEDRDANGLIDLISNGSGMRLVTQNLTGDDAGFFVDFVGNDASNSRDELGAGLSVLSTGTQATFEFDFFTGNQFNNNLGDGALIVADNPGTVRFNTIISGNEFIGNGYFVDDRDGDGATDGVDDVNLANTQDIDGDGAPGGDGLRIVSTGAGSEVFIAGIGDTTSTNSNIFSGNRDDGLQLDATDSAILSEFGVSGTIFIFNNTFNNNGDDGMFVNLDNAETNISFGLATDNTLGNSFTNNGTESDLGNGLTLYGQNNSVINGGIYGNTFTANAGTGLYIGLESGSILGADYQIVENTMTLNGLDGFQLNMDNASSDGLLLALNDASGNGRNGMNFLMQDSTLTDYTIIGNTINNNGNLTVPGPGGFTIDLAFTGTFTAAQTAAFQNAAARWAEIIIGDLPDVDIGGGTIIDDVLISAEVVDIDGPGGILGQAGPTAVRADGTFIPFQGQMQFDSADLAELEASGQLTDVILHEMGHVLGLGTIWDLKGLLQNPSNGDGVTDTRFTGPNAAAQYNAIFGVAGTSTPVENSGGPGTADGHWREATLDNELMTGFLNAGVNPISRITVGQWEDLGYVVDYTAADPYAAPLVGGAGARTINMNRFEDYAGPVTQTATLNNFFVSPALVPDPGSVGNGIHFDQTNGVATGAILQNTIDGNAEYGISTNLHGTANFTLNQFQANQITNNELGGINVIADDTTIYNDTVFTGNTVSNNGGIGYHIDANNDAVINLTVGGTFTSTFSGNADAGIGLEFEDNTIGNIDISNVIVQNTIDIGATTNFNGDGIAIIARDAANVDDIQIGNPTLTNTQLIGNAGAGVYIAGFNTAQVNNFVIENAIFRNNVDYGIRTERNGSASFTNEVIRNILADGNGVGISLVARNADVTDDYLLTNILIQNSGTNGLEGRVEADANMSIDFGLPAAGQAYTFRSLNNGNDGINLSQRINDPASDDPLIFNNTPWNNILVANNGGDGIEISANHDLDIGIVGGNVDIIDNDGNGILVTEHPNNLPTQLSILNVTDTLISGNGIFGVNIDNFNQLGTFSGNEISDNGIETGGDDPLTGGGVALNGVGNSDASRMLFEDNLVINNGGKGFDVSDSFVTIDSNAIYNNSWDGIEYTGTNSRIGTDGWMVVENNLIESNGGRGVDVMVSGLGTVSQVDINNNDIINNEGEGVYVVLSSEAQDQDGPTPVGPDDNTDASHGFTLGTSLINNPVLVFNMDNNLVSNNGLGSNFSGTGLVIRVGTTGLGFNEPVVGNPWEDNDGFVSDGTFAGGLASQGMLTGRGGVVASITNNTFSGNFGSDVYFESFASTVDPVTTAGAWTNQNDNPPNPANDQFDITAYQRDALSRFDLNFTGNTGTTADVNNVGAFYDNDESVFKSRTNGQTPGGPFTDGTRRRNAQRLASNDPPWTSLPPVQDTGDPDADNSAGFLFPGVGPSTFRITGASNTAGFSSGFAFGAINYNNGLTAGELDFQWDVIP
ncbi:beta strand repeat-containing protein [Lacunimicrobium album]